MTTEDSIFNLNAVNILGAHTHLILTAGNAIGTTAAPILTRVGKLTAATAVTGAGDIVIVEQDNLDIVERGSGPVYELDGFTIRAVTATSGFMLDILGAQNVINGLRRVFRPAFLCHTLRITPSVGGAPSGRLPRQNQRPNELFSGLLVFVF